MQMFDAGLNLNSKGPFELATHVALRMAEGQGDAIINVGSTGALMAPPMVIPHGRAKAGLNAMPVGPAKELAPEVRVNTLSPGPFLTDIAEAWDPAKRETARNAAGRPGRPGDRRRPAGAGIACVQLHGRRTVAVGRGEARVGA